MDNILLFVAVGVILAMVIGGIVIRNVQRTRAAKQAAQFAQERNWRYVTSDHSVVTSYPQLFPFYAAGRSTSQPGIRFGESSVGDARDVTCLTSGEYSGESFTYTYTTYDDDSEKSSSAKTHLWHIVGLELPAPFPHLIVRRRRTLELPQARLTKPVELPSADLNARYSVHSEHHPVAHDMMTLNGLIRDYFPKGIDFNTVSDAEIQAVVVQLNNRPRRTLGFYTPREKMNELIHGVALAL